MASLTNPPQPAELLAQLNQIIERPEIQEPVQRITSVYLANLGWLKAVSIFVTAFFILFAIYSMIKTGWLAIRLDRMQDVVLKSNLPKKRAIKAWKNIQRHFFAGDDNDLKIAVIEADTLLDEALRVAGFKGINLGERLKALDSSQLPNLNDVWEAHKLRNRLVHEADFRLSRDIAERALTVYEQTFRDLGLLE